jgi:hypothetical protein
LALPDPTKPEPLSLSTKAQTVMVTPDEDNMRVDRFQEARLPGLSFSHIQRIVRKGELRVNGDLPFGDRYVLLITMTASSRNHVTRRVESIAPALPPPQLPVCTDQRTSSDRPGRSGLCKDRTPHRHQLLLQSE